MKFLTGLVNGHNEQHQKEKNIKYIQKDMRARDGAGQDHENCDVNHDFILALTPTGDQNLTFGITKKIKKDPGEYSKFA